MYIQYVIVVILFFRNVISLVCYHFMAGFFIMVAAKLMTFEMHQIWVCKFKNAKFMSPIQSLRFNEEHKYLVLKEDQYFMHQN